jgi:uncharacterized protein YnzC (UPF0291/DUF896 family)
VLLDVKNEKLEADSFLHLLPTTNNNIMGGAVGRTRAASMQQHAATTPKSTRNDVAKASIPTTTSPLRDMKLGGAHNGLSVGVKGGGMIMLKTPPRIGPAGANSAHFSGDHRHDNDGSDSTPSTTSTSINHVHVEHDITHIGGGDVNYHQSGMRQQHIHVHAINNNSSEVTPLRVRPRSLALGLLSPLSAETEGHSREMARLIHMSATSDSLVHQNDDRLPSIAQIRDMALEEAKRQEQLRDRYLAIMSDTKTAIHAIRLVGQALVDFHTASLATSPSASLSSSTNDSDSKVEAKRGTVISCTFKYQSVEP